jgi:hypothetical protein
MRDLTLAELNTVMGAQASRAAACCGGRRVVLLRVLPGGTCRVYRSCPLTPDDPEPCYEYTECFI